MIHDSRQLTFLSGDQDFKNPADCKSESEHILKIYIDGAARNNPGPAGCGIYMLKENKVVFKQGFFLGTKTNNQAEYFGMLLGAFFAKEYVKQGEKILFYSDSLLLVRQMSGIYRVKDTFLQQLQKIALDLLKHNKVSFCHIYREYNTHADELANFGIDKKVSLPKKFIDILQGYQLIK